MRMIKYTWISYSSMESLYTTLILRVNWILTCHATDHKANEKEGHKSGFSWLCWCWRYYINVWVRKSIYRTHGLKCGGTWMHFSCFNSLLLLLLLFSLLLSCHLLILHTCYFDWKFHAIIQTKYNSLFV